MMRVLIADDEMKVCQLIRYLVHWEAYDMEVIGMAYNGEDAFDMIVREKPDLVITDIRMPGLDGIQLVEKTTQIPGIQTYFVIVSGYGQFEYARQAVRLGVQDYLLKPIRKKDLETVLEKVSGKHRAETKQREEKVQLKTELAQTKEKMKNNLLQDLLFSQADYFRTSEIAEIEARYGCSFKGSSYCTILGHLYPNSMEISGEEKQFAMSKLQKTFRERLEPVCEDFLCLVHDYEVICLLNLQQEQLDKLEMRMVRIGSVMNGIREMIPNARLAIIYEEGADVLQQGKEKLEKLRRMLLSRFSKRDYMILSAKDVSGAAWRMSDLITEDWRKQLRLEMELLHAEGVRTRIHEIQERMKEAMPIPETIYVVYREIIVSFLFGMQNYYKDAERPAIETYLRGLDIYASFEDAFDWLEDELSLIVQKQAKQQKDLESRPIRLAKKYIHDHIGENISLDSVSREVGLNPAYLSSVFKKDSGQNFMEYVTYVRMETAKNLLTRSGDSVIDIAYAVGYSDVKYFSKLFKKHSHLTPTEYRKLYH